MILQFWTKLVLSGICLVFLLGLFSCQSPAQINKKEPDNSELVKRLGSRVYAERREAISLLKNRGASAIPHLFAGLLAPDSSKETELACTQILNHLVKSDDDKIRNAFKKELNKYPVEKYPGKRLQINHFRLEVLDEVNLSEAEALKKLRKQGARCRLLGDRFKIQLDAWTGNPTDLRYLKAMERPIDLTIPEDMDPRSIRYLARANIVVLRLEHQSVHGEFDRENLIGMESCQAITRIKSLQELYFSYMGVPKLALKDIGNLKNLRTVCLPKGTCRKSIESLATLQHLEGLEFATMNRLEGDWFRPMAKCKSLRHLNLHQCQFAPENFQFLAELNLKSLECPQISTDDEGFKQIAKITSLDSLTLDNTLVTDIGLRGIENLKQLTYLTITESAITNRSIKILNARKLKHLNLQNTLITEAGYRKIECENKRKWNDGNLKTPSPIDYQLIQDLIDEGFVIRLAFNKTDSFDVVVPEKGLKAKHPRFAELERLSIEEFRLQCPIDEKLMTDILKLPTNFELAIRHADVTDEQIAQIRKHFKKVHDYRD